MNNIHKRIILFLVCCIGMRSLLVFMAKTIKPEYLPIMGLIALLPAIGFLYLFITGKRKTGAEVFGDRIWWNHLRPIHALLFFTFAINAIMKKKYSWIFLLIDLIIGLASFLVFHYNNSL